MPCSMPQSEPSTPKLALLTCIKNGFMPAVLIFPGSPCSVPDGAALTAVLEAAAYAGRSLARVGLDISALLAHATSAAVRALLQRQLALAAAMFLAAVDSHRWVVMPVAAGKARPEAASGGGNGADGGAAVLEAAQGLLSHPPLAVLVNAVRFMCPS